MIKLEKPCVIAHLNCHKIGIEQYESKYGYPEVVHKLPEKSLNNLPSNIDTATVESSVYDVRISPLGPIDVGVSGDHPSDPSSDGENELKGEY